MFEFACFLFVVPLFCLHLFVSPREMEIAIGDDFVRFQAQEDPPPAEDDERPPSFFNDSVPQNPCPMTRGDHAFYKSNEPRQTSTPSVLPPFHQRSPLARPTPPPPTSLPSLDAPSSPPSSSLDHPPFIGSYPTSPLPPPPPPPPTRPTLPTSPSSDSSSSLATLATTTSDELSFCSVLDFEFPPGSTFELVQRGLKDALNAVSTPSDGYQLQWEDPTKVKEEIKAVCEVSRRARSWRGSWRGGLGSGGRS